MQAFRPVHFTHYSQVQVHLPLSSSLQQRPCHQVQETHSPAIFAQKYLLKIRLIPRTVGQRNEAAQLSFSSLQLVVTFTQRCSFLGRLNVKNEEIDEMIKEAPGPINFTVFLTMFGEKLKGKREPGEQGWAWQVLTSHHHCVLSHMGKPLSSWGFQSLRVRPQVPADVQGGAEEMQVVLIMVCRAQERVRGCLSKAE